MKARFVSAANVELDEAVRYCEHELPGLGDRFFQEVDAAIERNRMFPEGWAKVGRQTRRCMVKGFPYALFYTIENAKILVLAVAHLHRDTEHYRERIV